MADLDYDELVRLGYANGCYPECQHGRHQCSYHEGWSDAAALITDRLENDG